MIGQKRRFFYLIAIMVVLVMAVSWFSSYNMYLTALNEQKNRLFDVVNIQKNVVSEIGLRMWGGERIDEKALVNILVRAHSLFMKERESVEFTVAKKSGDSVRFLIVNGRAVDKSSPIAKVAFDGDLAVPMKKALLRQVGTIIGRDYKNHEVLAAYTFVQTGDQLLGLVAKVDLKAIKTPFIKASILALGFGAVLTIIGVWLFYRISDSFFQQLYQSEESYRGLVESANSIILRVNSEYEITFANGFAIEYLSSTEEGLIGSSFLSLFEEQLNAESITEVAGILKDRTSLNPIQIAADQKTPGWVAWRVRLLDEEDTELLCIGTDVSSEYMARESQKEIQERFRALAKAAPVGIIITEMQGNLIYANETMHALTRASTVEMAGMGWLTFIDSAYEQNLHESWFIKKKYEERYEFQLKDKEGTEHWILGQAVPLKNVDDVDVGSLVTMTDITRVKEAEIAQSRLTAAIEQAAEMIIITDLGGKIQYVNPTFVEVTGYSKDEAVGETPRLINSGEQGAEFYEDLWGTLTAGNIWSGRFLNKRKNGEIYTQESTIAPIRNAQGECIGYVGVARDISEQLFMEARLRQSQKLESIGELAAGIAHEINTPTQYVASNLQFFEDSFKTYAELAEKYFQLTDCIANKEQDDGSARLEEMVDNGIDNEEIGYLNEDLPNAIKESEAGLKRISEIVQSIKQLAHPGETSKSFWSLNEIVKDAVTVSTNEWRYCAEVRMELDDSLPQVYCLKAEIGQVVLNLVVNAAHAIEAARTSPDQQGHIDLRTTPDGEYALLEVTDSGTGIPDDVLARIFDPFFTTKEVGKGTGQGLAIAHNVITNQHSGTIEVVSTPGEGSTFKVRIPFEKEDQSTPS